MDKTKPVSVRYYEQQNLQMPEDMRDRFQLNKTDLIDKAIAENGDKIVFSWITEFGSTWNFLANMYRIDVLPPPFTLDRRKNPPRSTTIEIGENGKDTLTQYILGMFNSCATVHTNADDQLSAIIPYDYELRIFESNFIMEMRKIWKWRLPVHAMKAVVFHVLAHECLHYLNLATKYQTMVYDLNPETAQSVYDAIANFGSFNDEMINEYLTIQVMIWRFLDLKYGMNPGIGYDVDEKKRGDINLSVIINSRFDHFMRKKDPVYNDISHYIEFLIMQWADRFDVRSDKNLDPTRPVPFANLRKPGELDLVTDEMLKTHEKSWKETGKPKYLFVD